MLQRRRVVCAWAFVSPNESLFWRKWGDQDMYHVGLCCELLGRDIYLKQLFGYYGILRLHLVTWLLYDLFATL